MPFRTTGTLSKLYVRVGSNLTTGGTNTVTVRKNEAATAMTVTIGTGATGDFEDVTNIVAVTAGDFMAIEHVTGTGGGLSYGVISVLFASTNTTNTVTVLQSGDFTTATTASVTRYNLFAGASGNAASTEVNTQYTARTVGTLKNMALSTATNGRTTDTLVRSRKNTADGAMLITVAATSDNMIMEDTVNSDAIAAGDLTNWNYVTGTGSGTCDFEYVKFEFETTNNKFLLFSGESSAISHGFGTTLHTCIAGNMSTNTNEVQKQTPTRLAITLANLSVRVFTNTINSGTSTVTVRKNEANTAMVASIGFGATGVFENTIDIDTTNETDKINYTTVISGTSGTVAIRLMACLGEELFTQSILDNQSTQQASANIARTKTMRSMPVWC